MEDIINNNVENIESDNYELNIGNISIVIPNDYYIIRNSFLTNSIKRFYGFRYKKEIEVDEPGATNVPALIDYINGISEEKHTYLIGPMRRNKFNDIKVCDTLTLILFSYDDTRFERKILFTDDEYFYSMKIYFEGEDFIKEMKYELPDYFDDNGNWIDDKVNEIYNQFTNFQKMPEYIENLITETDNVYNTMVFMEK
jgi:hypothetical protein